MPLYDKPIWALIEDALGEMPEVFTTVDLLNWFRSRYPKIKESSLRAHIVGMSVNNPTRRFYSGTLSHGLLYRLGRSKFTRYDPARHGSFDSFGRQQGVSDEDDSLTAFVPSEMGLEDEQVEAVTEFALEMHLEEFMERNWTQIDFGRPLNIWTDQNGLSGRQYPTDVGYIDFLCKDPTEDAFVVVELKRGRTSDAVVGQTQRYMGWVKRNLSSNAPVFGMIIASEIDEKLHYALDVTTNLSARQYRVQFELVEPEAHFAR
jgi:hypothetical protein